jgi:hypothetical protein
MSASFIIHHSVDSNEQIKWIIRKRGGEKRSNFCSEAEEMSSLCFSLMILTNADFKYTPVSQAVERNSF